MAFWQAGKYVGAALVNEPGTVIWNELITSDPAAARFYEQVLGVTTAPMDDMGMGDYTLFVYFAVTDADATAGRVTELGGTVLAAPFDTPVGRMAVTSDPQGAAFSIVQPPADQPG